MVQNESSPPLKKAPTPSAVVPSGGGRSGASTGTGVNLELHAASWDWIRACPSSSPGSTGLPTRSGAPRAIAGINVKGRAKSPVAAAGTENSNCSRRARAPSSIAAAIFAGPDRTVVA